MIAQRKGMSVGSNDFTPVDGLIPEGEAPPGTMFTRHVTQKHLKECERAINRPLLPNEVKVLDEVMHAQHCANTSLARKGFADRGKSIDEVCEVFCERLTIYAAQKVADDILSNQSKP